MVTASLAMYPPFIYVAKVERNIKMVAFLSGTMFLFIVPNSMLSVIVNAQ